MTKTPFSLQRLASFLIVGFFILSTAAVFQNCGSGFKSPDQAAVASAPSTPPIYATLFAGYEMTCHLTANDALDCWGYNNFGQLGDGTMTNQTSPELISALTGTSELSGGSGFTCALNNLNTLNPVQCWGYNNSGQLGNGTTTNSLAPVAVSNLTQATSISAGYDGHVCALNQGLVYCWGNNFYGQLGNGANLNSSVPVAVTGLSGVTAISSGNDFSCALMNQGTVQCWGYNNDGQLGNDSTINSNVPVLVQNLTTAIAISAGYLHVCALLNDGTVQCWGDNTFGELGSITNPPNFNPVPVAVPNLSGVTEISLGNGSSCALMAGNVNCWGDNSVGQLGNGNTTNSTAPSQIMNLTNAISISTGDRHACAVTAQDAVYCWGNNAEGQLGNGSTTSSSLPVQAQ